ncbi:tetratricopeptide repeat protein [Shouchella sp. JSM 1781072]|uniref:tetratricopeptide repeat protein n=1 Tax=Bacillaceae TaxID=186817 RepID=UPI000C075495|nr:MULTISPECIES: tetratricopeptide repeat protein [Bacillaceae]UTR05882.1 tetratricopeptide repeat protein [Alkalihalobacillus sp. LMS6]
MKGRVVEEAIATIKFDESHFLRERSDEPEKLIQAIAVLHAHKSDDQEEVYRIQSMLGYLYRVIGDSESALTCYHTCHSIVVKQKKKHAIIATLIRIGETLKYAERHDEALRMFEQAKDYAVKHQTLQYDDFILQHKGKCLWEMNQLKEANACFEAAYQLRLEKNDKALISSTKQALTLVKTDYC